jgi:hypothetical protein
MKPFRRLLLRPLVALLVVACPAPAFAQASPAPSPAASLAPSPQLKADAERHFKRGLELFDEDDFQGARIEFGRAYQLVPNFHVLFNLGQVNFQLQDYVAALHAFEKYLSDGGAAVTRDRKDVVERDIAKLRLRVATLTITTTPGAVVTVDGVLAGTAPLAPIQVSGGRRVLRATLPLHEPVEKTLDLAGGDSTRVELVIMEPKTATGEPSTFDASSASGSPPWALWVVTGALVAGTVVTGVLALGASSAASDIRSSGGAFADYQSDEQRMRTFSLTTDILGAATIVIAGLATYFTVTSGPKKTGLVAPAPRVQLGRGGGRLSLSF